MRVIPIVSDTGIAQAQVKRAKTGLTSLPALSLYVHVPWCVRKCPYCDFNSHQVPEQLPEREYLDALTSDLDQALPDIWGRQVHTIFIGGGTPSLLSAKAIDEMLAVIRARLNLWPDAEITLEANPGASESERFKSYVASGVNRLSLGIQSFNDNHLKALGRVHDSAQAQRAIEMALNAAPRVNLDLMYGLPEQTVAQCREDLDKMVSFGAEHLSVYQLTLEPQTVFAKYPPILPTDDVMAAMEDAIEEVVEQGGWRRYEVSAYAKPNAHARHNMNYWTFGDYLGIGPGAHSKLSFPDKIVRQARTRNPAQWMEASARLDGSHISEQRELGADDLPFEFFLNALRLRDGVEIDLFNAHTGLHLSDILAPVQTAADKGLLHIDHQTIRATALGWRHLNDLMAVFLK